ncbi:transglycosylase family protein [Bradyrhizobium sp. YR681]|uniref:lytic transglycosylase domain-containing protein n=1 Tax=Bradyrhizobium sp. YR681 TaxID=1144344 RepID=UPI0002711BDA|nr:lytic transglycosylase domain-containing protein [Bradyrhizobium sp. YR681]EJN13090.1 transglycosylase family protein [Bradyrhizobium sp. YR681]
MTTGMVKTDNLALRKTPDPNGVSTGILQNGAVFDAITSLHMSNVLWWLVSTKFDAETRVGWLQAEFLQFDGPVVGRLDWSKTPQLGSSGFHNFKGGQNWKFDSDGVYLEDDPDNPRRSGGEPKTCAAILDIYEQQIFDASMKHGIPPELIVMTIATESGADRKTKFTGAPTFRWEAAHTTYSAGPMQTLATTAEEVIDILQLSYNKKTVAPAFAIKPNPIPDDLKLYDGATNIDIGTGEIKLNNKRHSTGFDPILVAACYNAGSLRETNANPWNLFTFGDHLNRSAEWIGDACFLLKKLRGGGMLDPEVARSNPQNVVNDSDPDKFQVTGLLSDDADAEVAYFRDAGAEAQKIKTPDGFFSVLVSFPKDLTEPPARQEALPPVTFADPTDTKGYVLCIDRIRTEQRKGMGYARTVGIYQAYIDGKKIPEISGMVCERQGPGDNTKVGQNEHQRLKAGAYRLFTHAGASQKYRTHNYTKSSVPGATARPCLRVADTGVREGVLIHPAQGYLWSIGCLNLTAPLSGPQDNINYAESRRRVIALIDNMAATMADFPSSDNRDTGATLLIRDHDA